MKGLTTVRTYAAGALVAASLAVPLAAGATENGATVIMRGDNVFVRGATVNAVSGTSSNGVIGASSVLGPSMLAWTVQTNASTAFSGSAIDFSKIAIGDVISFFGTLTGNGLNVAAKAIVEHGANASTSLPFFRGKLDGQVASVTTNGFTLRKGEKNSIQVVLAASTTIRTSSGATTTVASITSGDEVKVAGSWNSDRSVFTATSVVIKGNDQKTHEDGGSIGSFVRGLLSGSSDVRKGDKEGDHSGIRKDIKHLLGDVGVHVDGGLKLQLGDDKGDGE